MQSFWYLGNGDYTIKSRKTTNKPSGYGIWNNAANTWHNGLTVDFVWPNRDKLIQWLDNRNLFVALGEVIQNPYTSLAYNLTGLTQAHHTGYNERLVIGLTLASISDIVAYGHNRTGKLTDNRLEQKTDFEPKA